MEAWSRPVENSLLASTRLAGTGNNSTVNSNSVCKTVSVFVFVFFWPKMQIVNFIYAATVIYFFQNQSTVFCVRCGTPRGIITHWFRSETNRDMAAWARALVQGSHNAINYQREFSFRCLYQVMSKTELHRIRWINFCSFFFAISHNIFFFLLLESAMPVNCAFRPWIFVDR